MRACGGVGLGLGEEFGLAYLAGEVGDGWSSLGAVEGGLRARCR